MSQVYEEGTLRFEFPDDWLVCRPGKCSFYIAHFQWLAGGCKEMDFVAYEPQSKTIFLIEVKDYASSGRTKPSEMHEEVAIKVRDSLALLPASMRDENTLQAEGLGVGEFWRRARRYEAIRVVLHYETPRHPSPAYPNLPEASNVLSRLKRAVRVVDPRPVVLTVENPGNFGWSVSRITPPPARRQI